MKHLTWFVISLLFLVIAACQVSRRRVVQTKSCRLPAWTYPEITEWLWSDSEFQPQGYEPFLNLVADHSPFNMVLVLTEHTSKTWRQITDVSVHDQIDQAVEYAHKHGLRIAFDLDVRLARQKFLKEHPDQQQWMLRVKAFPISWDTGGATPSGPSYKAEIEPAIEQDHMTGPLGSYDVLEGRLERVYLAASSGNGATGVLKDITADCHVVEQSAHRVAVAIPPERFPAGTEAIVVAGFKYEYPASFAPDIIKFQTHMLEQYRDTHMDGALKEEWGFPPGYTQGPKAGDFWYSKWFAAAYSKAGGGSFIRDCVLMTSGVGGTYDQRIADVNRYEHLILARSTEIEENFYKDVKQVFGPDAFVGTHATWGFMPTGDAFKNGYDWWGAKRDYGQVDEEYPISLCTALAKKMGSPVWYRQYYNADTAAFYTKIWQAARTGGRINFLRYPYDYHLKDYERILEPTLMRAETRIRLLNFITKSPLNCPVAVVFGHTAALNWVGPYFGDLGWAFAHALRKLGLPADDIPSSEIQSGALKINTDGSATYGAQHYKALVFLNPEYEPSSTFAFLRQAAASKTFLFMRGTSQYSFDGKRRNSTDVRVPGAMTDATPSHVAEFLYGQMHPAGKVHPLNPPDLAHLTDGTCLIARGAKDPSGDDIQGSFYCQDGQSPLSTKIKMHATGVFAIRLSGTGKVESLAASDLRFVDAGSFHLHLRQPTDLALWHDKDGQWRGAIQGAKGIPRPLLRLTRDWFRLTLPSSP
jgi:hypothetical protein